MITSSFNSVGFGYGRHTEINPQPKQEKVVAKPTPRPTAPRMTMTQGPHIPPVVKKAVKQVVSVVV